MKDEALKLALEALDNLARYADTCELFLKETHPGKADALRERVTISIKAITAIKQALEAPVQEPVAWMHKETGLLRQANKAKGGDFEPNHWTPLYTTPPAQRQWVGLTTEDMATCIDEPAWDLILRKAEQILKEKNT